MSFGWNTLLEMQQHACTEHADRNVFGTKQPDGRFDWITYAEFGDMVDRCRGALAAAGLERGDKVFPHSPPPMQGSLLATTTAATEP